MNAPVIHKFQHSDGQVCTEQERRVRGPSLVLGMDWSYQSPGPTGYLPEFWSSSYAFRCRECCVRTPSLGDHHAHRRNIPSGFSIHVHSTRVAKFGVSVVSHLTSAHPLFHRPEPPARRALVLMVASRTAAPILAIMTRLR